MDKRSGIARITSGAGGFFRVAQQWLSHRSMTRAALASAALPPSSTTAETSAQRTRVSGRDLGTIALAAAQLALVLIIIYRYQLESRTFFYVMLLGAAGFVVHALLPLQYRLPFFVLLSIAAIGVALGPLDGIFLLTLGLVLIGICHLPLRMAFRVSLLAATGALFAVWRMELLPAPWSVAIWP